MRLIISGSRVFPDSVDIDSIVIQWMISMWYMYRYDEVVCGAASKGVDAIVDEIMKSMLPGAEYTWIPLEPLKKSDIKYTPMPAKWDDLEAEGAIVARNKYGKPYNVDAGFARNREMAHYGDILLAIWNGTSNGTKHMVRQMEIVGKPYVLVKV